MTTPTFYFIGGDKIDWMAGIEPNYTTNTDYFRSAYARSAIKSLQNQIMRTNELDGGGITSGWLTAYLYYDNDSDSGYSLMIGLASDINTYYPGIYVGLNTSNRFSIAHRAADGTITHLATDTGSLIENNSFRIDLQLISFGASGTVNLYVNGSLLLTYTGDLSISGVSDLNILASRSHVSNNRWYISEVACSDSDTRNIIAIQTRYPDAAGDTNDFTGAYTDVDEAAYNDADLIYSDTNGDDVQFSLIDTPSMTARVVGKKISVRAAKSADSAVSTLKLGEKITGGALDLDAGQTVAEGFATYERYMNEIETLTVADTKQIAMSVET